MAKIKVLGPEIYNLISAGEVVDQPIGAVKELVENSIDAGARRISIEIANGGLELISVTDNGCGMQEDDLNLAFLKHATSKLSCANDLFAVQTLGFRGEALASIAAVSRVMVTTRANGEDYGISVLVENGQLTNKQYVSANVGTRIEVRDLFANVPARKTFLKTSASEAAQITKYIAKLMLANPNLEISYTLDCKKVYETKGNGLEEAIFAIYGNDCLKNCLRVSYSLENLRITGYVGSPEYTKANRNYQTLSVNGRCVKDDTVSAAIMQAFKPFLMTRQYPFYVLDLDVPCDCVDVNVHPRKEEVRFTNSRKIFSAFYHAVANALEEFSKQRATEILSSEEVKLISREEFILRYNQIMQDERIEIMNPGQCEDVRAIEESTREADKVESFEAFSQRIEQEITVEKARRNIGLDNLDTVRQSQIEIRPQETVVPIINEVSEEDVLFERARILGVAFKTYLILEIDEKIIFVDQHAAHERILFDSFMARKMQTIQPVMFPYVFTVNDDEAIFIEENIENIKSAGIEVEAFGHNTFRIVGVSTLLSDTKMEKFVQFLLSSVEEMRIDDRALIVETIAKKACRAAVKAGYSLNEYEIKYILKQVCDNKIVQCPHGRPITTVFTKNQFEKMFKRIV